MHKIITCSERAYIQK